MAKKDIHDVHVSADGRFRWSEADGLHRHDQAFAGAPRDIPLTEQGGTPVTLPDPNGEPAPLPMVVLRCRCGDPDSHAQQGQHCPQAEVDAGESMIVSVDWQQQRP